MTPRARRALRSAAVLAATGMAATALAATVAAETSDDRAARACRQAPLAVEVLGAGGPMHGDGRGSAAYALWRRGRAEILVDMGGDTATALARAGATPGMSRALLLSHFHPDHVSGLPDFVWGEITAGRRSPLTVVGPPAGDGFLGVRRLVERLFGEDGAFPDLKAVLGSAGFFLQVHEAGAGETVVEALADVRIVARRVPHGRAPTLAYRIDIDGRRIVFGSDQTARDPAFHAFAKAADLLVLHAILAPAAGGRPIDRVVALPADVGRAAAAARPRRLVLGHLMAAPADSASASWWSLSALGEVEREVRRHYSGPIDVARDSSCYVVRAEP